MLKALKLLAILLTLLLLVLVFYGIFKGIFDSLVFWGLYLLLLAADFLCIAVIKKYNGQGEC
ncbi:MAG: hypothetical protein PHR04_04020 [Syntrophomonadaceae bacterium]|nr:hypothetical protein [Syntrophomonadaceae bacterium]MDD3271249.1 hypothetical protein [Syntrophomonadaceae bacterium]MDD3898531.1 hypothetical protein [Syntrophomonadaceae bacterium]MDD4562324.1 hypothetical protein [Syntrophomonadaceae bacterium]